MGNSNFANHPFLLGFERLDRLMERSGQNDGYPPYNIEQVSENDFRISLAVAGFAEQELDITLANGELLIKGAQSEDPTPRTYLHQGIAARQFQRRFVLADGLLHIELRRDVQELVSQKIEINPR